MKNFDTRVYSIADFLEWHNNGLLELSPDFQRRSVWSEKAKSYLIDTIITGKPIPKILITQRLEGARSVRIVVDGQQRLRAILGFINNDFKISRAHNKDLAGFTFDKLPSDAQQAYLQYELGVDLLLGVDYEEILDIFARINSYTVSLNKQEKINASYLGFFKQFAFKYGYQYVKYFLEAGVLTKAQVTRMAEAELSADLFVSLIDAVQTNKSNEKFYKLFDDTIGPLEEAATRFDNIMSYIGSIYPPKELAQTNWSRVQLFYSLFTAIGHCLYGIENLDKNQRATLNKKLIGKIRNRLDEISAKYDEVASTMDKKGTTTDIEWNNFVNWSRRGTTDTGARIGRANFICSQLMSL
ncbi:MAG: DUF262 domain-containing protein [Betaproteobacteria bacterium]|nr:DUF262 domain-containing protein [Betaproteobacteria bacterium]